MWAVETNAPDASNAPGLAAGPAYRNSLTAAWPFGLFAALWAGALGIVLGWVESFLTGDGFWQITLIMVGCAFWAGTLAHMIVSGHKCLLRAALAGALTPFLAVAFGAAVQAWTALPHMSLTGLAFVVLPLCLPSALLGLVIGAARTRKHLRRSWRKHQPNA